MNTVGGNAKFLRENALRDILTRAEDAHRARLAATGSIHADNDEAELGDQLDVATEHTRAATNARLSEHRWSTRAVLDDALERFRLGFYGFCDECADEISLERLSVVPFAALCVDCQRQRERKQVIERSGPALDVPIFPIEPMVHSSDDGEATQAQPRRRKIGLASARRQFRPLQTKRPAKARG